MYKYILDTLKIHAAYYKVNAENMDSGPNETKMLFWRSLVLEGNFRDYK